MILVLTASQGFDKRFAELDVAGRPLAQHLSAALERRQVVRTVIQRSGGAELGDGSEGVLWVSAEAWLTDAAVGQLVVALAEKPLRIAIDGEVVGVYLPPKVFATLARDTLGDSPSTVAAALGPEAQTIEFSISEARRVESFADVAEIERVIFDERTHAAMSAGVRIHDPETVRIRGSLTCGADVEIDRNVIIEGNVALADGAKIGANCVLIESNIGAGAIVKPFSIVEGAVVGARSFIGPYGRVRPGSVLGASVQIGNFVEIKNADIGEGSRVNHLAFIGDSTLGARVTIGAATITCNHNRVGVARTQIGEGAYVGSGTLLVAPVTIGANATVGAGSTITEDVPADKLTIARARQVTIDGWKPPASDSGGQ